MARNIETSQQIIISAATKKKNTPRKTLLVYVQEEKPQHKSTKIRSKVLTFNANLIKQHKHDTSPSLRCSRKNRNDRKKLYEANHLYLMKLALIRTNLQEKHHIKISPIHNKRRPIILKARRKFQISPLDGAQYAKFHRLRKQQPGKQTKKQQQNEKKRHTLTLAENRRTNPSSHKHCNSYFNL